MKKGKTLLALVMVYVISYLSSYPQSFTDINAVLTGISYGNGVWGDYDNDNDLDVMIAGNGTSRLYRNDGGNVFTYISTTISGMNIGACAWGDYDNDGDLDLAITGSFSGTKASKIYRNDGGNVFTDINAGLVGLDNSALAWGDYDNDGKLDLLVSGLGTGDEPIAKLYHNDGSNIFSDSEINITPFVRGMIKWGDYNNDGLLDILMIGQDFNGNANTEIYRNDGNNHFIGITAGLNRGFRGGVDWGDYDNDGDLDVLIGGQQCGTNVYRNNGDNTFTNVNAGIQGLSYCSVAWGDYDNDGDLDIAVAGINVSDGKRYTQLFQNKGNNVFTEDSNTLIDISYGSLSWGDYDKDGDVDLLLIGSDASTYQAKIYRNDSPNVNTSPTIPSGIQTTVINNGAILKWNRSTDSQTPSAGLTYNVRIGTTSNGFNILSPMSDMTTGFNRKAFIGNGMQNSSFIVKNLPVGTYYWSVQAADHNFKTSAFSSTGSFNILPSATDMNVNMVAVNNNALAWGDYDNDGFMDLLLAGYDSPTSKYVSKIYHNNGSGVFDTINAKLKGMEYSTCSWVDYDNDGDLDVFLAGNTAAYPINNPVTKIYRNNGNGTFTDIFTNIPGVGFSSSAWGDYDNDGDPDLLLTGSTLSTIFRNDGNGVFVDIHSSFVTTNQGTACWADYDKDNDLDAMVDGTSGTRIYRNDGSDKFVLNNSLPGSTESSAAWGDYDNDGYPDVLITGSLNGFNSVKVYRNDHTGGFTDINAVIRGVSESSGVWGDFNNDGYSDILYSGRSGNFIAKVYINNKDGTFTDINAPITSDYRSRVAAADFDNDGDLDFMITRFGQKPLLYRNNMNFPNDPPGVPSNLKAENSGMGAILSWDPAIDNQSKNGGLYYNLRLGKTPMGYDIIAPMVTSATNKKRTIPAIGNAQLNTSWRIDSLPVGTYYWSVQAIDQSFTGGSWAVENSFIVSQLRPYFKADTVCLGVNTSFTDQTITTGTKISTWRWNFGDGQISSVQHPVHLYSAAGIYPVTLEVTDTSGVKLSKTNNVIVRQRPTAIFSVSDVCIGNMVSVINTSNANGLTISSWTWDYGETPPSTSNQQYPSPHAYLKTGTYNIKLSVAATNGCTGSIVNPVKVAEYPSAVISAAGNPEFCEGGSVKLSVQYNSNYLFAWKVGTAPVTGADSSVYVATFTGNFIASVTNKTAGCNSESITPVSVVVSPAPSQPLIALTNYVEGKCLGENPVRLSVDQPVSAYSYQWTRNGAPIDLATGSFLEGYLSQGTYTVEASIGSCKTVSASKILTFPDAPDKPLIYPQGPNVWYLVCSNNSASVYKWYYNGSLIPGATDYLYVAGKNYGKYYVVIANSKGCYNMSDVATIPTGTTGIENVDPIGGLKVYPNPTTGLFTLEMDNQLFGDLNISVITQTGQQVLKIRFEKTTVRFSSQVDLSGQSKGIYFIKLQLDKYSVVKRVVVE